MLPPELDLHGETLKILRDADERRKRKNQGGGANGSANSPDRRGAVPLQAKDALAIYNADFPPQVFVVNDILPRGLTLAAGRAPSAATGAARAARCR